MISGQSKTSANGEDVKAKGEGKSAHPPAQIIAHIELEKDWRRSWELSVASFMNPVVGCKNEELVEAKDPS